MRAQTLTISSPALARTTVVTPPHFPAPCLRCRLQHPQRNMSAPPCTSRETCIIYYAYHYTPSIPGAAYDAFAFALVAGLLTWQTYRYSAKGLRYMWWAPIMAAAEAIGYATRAYTVSAPSIGPLVVSQVSKGERSTSPRDWNWFCGQTHAGASSRRLHSHRIRADDTAAGPDLPSPRAVRGRRQALHRHGPSLRLPASSLGVPRVPRLRRHVPCHPRQRQRYSVIEPPGAWKAGRAGALPSRRCSTPPIDHDDG